MSMTNDTTKEPETVTVTVPQLAEVRTMLDRLEQSIVKQGAGDAARASAAAPLPRGNTQRRKKGRDTMTVLQAVQTPSSNAPSFASLIQDAIDLGTQAGLGKDVQIKFDIKIAEAAYAGSLTLDADKHGKDVDDANKLTEAYVKAQGSAIVFDAKAGNQRKTISNTRKMIKFGSCPKWGVGQPMGMINDFLTMRQTLRKDPANAKKLDDAHNSLMRLATAQLKRDTLMDDAELRTFCFKRESEPRTAEEVLESIRKTANALKLGKVANCPDLDTSPEVQAIINACTKRLTTIAKARAPQGGAPATP